MSRPKSANRELLLVGIGVCVIAAIILLRLNTGGQGTATGAEPAALEAAETDRSRSRGRITRVASAEEPERKPRPRVESAETTPPAPAPTPEYQPVEIKRNYYSDKFENSGASLEGYKLDGLVRTAEGLTLAPRDSQSTETEEGKIRKGVIESPPLPLQFPSNYMMPLWRQKLPEGTGITIEMAISPDSNEWSRWFALEPNGDDISPTYPDGSPNPNYGFVGGTGIANGTRLYPFAKYRVTMTSGDAANSPVLHEFKIYYIDSAGPDGVLAERPSTGTPSNSN